MSCRPVMIRGTAVWFGDPNTTDCLCTWQVDHPASPTTVRSLAMLGAAMLTLSRGSGWLDGGSLRLPEQLPQALVADIDRALGLPEEDA